MRHLLLQAWMFSLGLVIIMATCPTCNISEKSAQKNCAEWDDEHCCCLHLGCKLDNGTIMPVGARMPNEDTCQFCKCSDDTCIQENCRELTLNCEEGGNRRDPCCDVCKSIKVIEPECRGREQMYEPGQALLETCRSCYCNEMGQFECWIPRCRKVPFDVNQEKLCAEWDEDGCCCLHKGCKLDNGTMLPVGALMPGTHPCKFCHSGRCKKGACPTVNCAAVSDDCVETKQDPQTCCDICTKMKFHKPNCKSGSRTYGPSQTWTERCRTCRCHQWGDESWCQGPPCRNPYEVEHERLCLGWETGGCCCGRFGCRIKGRYYNVGAWYEKTDDACYKCKCKVPRSCIMKTPCPTTTLSCQSTIQDPDNPCCSTCGPKYTVTSGLEPSVTPNFLLSTLALALALLWSRVDVTLGYDVTLRMHAAASASDVTITRDLLASQPGVSRTNCGSTSSGHAGIPVLPSTPASPRHTSAAGDC